MRNNHKIILAGAVALATVFTACQREQAVDNPNYNEETNEVLTSFVFNVATANTPQTKMTSANTQATSTDNFRGIEDARLITFLRNSPVADGKYITDDNTAANKQYNLGNVMSTSDATTDQTKSHRVIELALPNETNTLMFYGKAPKEGTNADFAQGKINYLANVTNSNATDLSNYNFSLNRIVEVNASGYNEKYRHYGDLILAAINYITGAEINRNVTFEGTNYPTQLKWTHYATISAGGIIKVATKEPVDGDPISPIGEILGDALATLATIPTGEVRAGSGPALSRTMGDLWVVMNNIHNMTPTTLHDAQAKAVADEIKSRIEACFDGTAPSLKWQEVSNVVTATGYTGEVGDVIRIAGTGSALDEYPMEAFNLPAGCSQITAAFTASTDTDGKVTTPGTITWSYLANVQMFNTTGSTSCYSVYYPAELCYIGNSPIRVTNENVVESEYPQGVANWDTETSWTSKNWSKNSHVVSTTRSVAMQYNINYGTALFKSDLTYGAATLYDNNHNIQLDKNPSLGPTDEPNAEITVTDNTFRLKGVLVGGVPTSVGWDFLPESGATFAQCIYDKAVASASIPASGTSAPNYTLVWDNWNETKKGAQQNLVYVCFEFENNSGKDFWGQHNIIRNGGIFYIIGKLDPDAGRDPSDRSEGVTWPTDGLQALPPFNVDGSTLKERRVFIQDFMTTAHFVIGANSLQYAYSTVPDLRSTQISLGLSVDLKWETGLVFSNVELGNN